jgi:hypothetical protein
MFCLCLSILGLLVYIYSCTSNGTGRGVATKKPGPHYSKEVLAQKYHAIVEQLTTIRRIHTAGTVMEEDAQALSMIARAQTMIREYVSMKYGDQEQFYIAMQLAFPKSMIDQAASSEEGAGGDSDGDGKGVANATIIIETAPLSLVPYSVFYFLEIVEHFQRGAFHRSAGHVLQSFVELDRGRKPKPKPKGEKSGGSDDQQNEDDEESHEHVSQAHENIFTQANPLAWQEYNKAYPHVQWTLGYAGRPGGPAFYISIEDNTDNHGPGSQGSKTEADACFGRIVRGKHVAQRMKKQPGPKDANGFLSDTTNNIRILGFHLLTILDD